MTRESLNYVKRIGSPSLHKGFVTKIKKNTEFKGVLKLLTGTIHISYLVTMVTFIRDSSDIVQLKESPFTKPETITNISTSTLMAVKILLTHADSLTPKERRPEKKMVIRKRVV